MSRTRRLAASLPWPLLAGVLVIGYLAWPMLFTNSGMAQDWVNQLWYVWQQGLSIRADHAPTLFLQSGGAVFYPLYAFYGGTLFALVGGLSALLGDAPVKAYVAGWLLAFCAAYGGWYWLGRLAGLGRWLAQVPGLVFVTSGYYLTLIYARGDWPEFVGVSMIPLVLAAGLTVLFTDRLRGGPALALAVGTIVLFGSHSITMLWASTLIVVLAALLLALVPEARRRVTRAGVLRVAVVVAPSILVNAWFLFPAAAYSAKTNIAQSYPYAQTVSDTQFIVSLAHLFTFSRASAVTDTADFITALPVLAVVWAVAVVALSLRRGGSVTWRRLLWILAGLTVAVGVLMTHAGLINDLPKPYNQLQFSYRLETYVLLGLCGTILAGLALLRDDRGVPARAARWALVAVLAASLVDAIVQVQTHPSVVKDRNVVFAADNQPPSTAGGLGDYDDGSLPLVTTPGLPGVTFPPAAVHHDRVAATFTLPPGVETFHTNLAGGPYLVAVSGARVAGRDIDDHIVLALRSDAHGRPVTVTLGTSHRLPVVAGRLVSLLSIAFLLVGGTLLLARRVRERGRRPAGAAAAGATCETRAR